MLVSLSAYAAAKKFLGGGDAFPDLVPDVRAEKASAPELVSYPQKTDLILLTDRPPQLETPLRYFTTDLTPNDAFFVRWHLSGVPTSVDTRNFDSK